MCIKNHIALITMILLSCDSIAAELPSETFTQKQKEQIGEIASDYLVAHPEILIKISQELQEKQDEKKQKMLVEGVVKNQAALLNDPDTPVFGPKNAKVAVIEFFDYQCVYCSRMAPELESVMKSNANVRYIFKEWPIFASRWSASLKAAEKGLSIWKSYGVDDYLKYHNGIYATNHYEGKLTDEDIENVSANVIKKTTDKEKSVNTKMILDKNNQLARALGLTGTPGLVVMPTNQESITPDKITVLPGMASAQQLSAAIKKAGE